MAARRVMRAVLLRRAAPLALAVLAPVVLAGCGHVDVGPVPERTCPPYCHASR